MKKAFALMLTLSLSFACAEKIQGLKLFNQGRYPEAVQDFQQDLNLDDPQEVAYLAYSLYQAKGDIETVLDYASRAAREGHPLGIYLEGGLRQQDAANLGPAQRSLGLQELETLERFWNPEFDDDLDAQLALGLTYTLKSYAAGTLEPELGPAALKRAAELGSTFALVRLAQLVSEDRLEAAVPFHLQAALQGNVESLQFFQDLMEGKNPHLDYHDLTPLVRAQLHEHGIGTKVDEQAAAISYLQAVMVKEDVPADKVRWAGERLKVLAQQDQTQALYWMGRFTALGVYFPKDTLAVKALYRRYMKVAGNTGIAREYLDLDTRTSDQVSRNPYVDGWPTIPITDALLTTWLPGARWDSAKGTLTVKNQTVKVYQELKNGNLFLVKSPEGTVLVPLPFLENFGVKVTRDIKEQVFLVESQSDLWVIDARLKTRELTSERLLALRDQEKQEEQQKQQEAQALTKHQNMQAAQKKFGKVLGAGRSVMQTPFCQYHGCTKVGQDTQGKSVFYQYLLNHVTATHLLEVGFDTQQKLFQTVTVKGDFDYNVLRDNFVWMNDLVLTFTGLELSKDFFDSCITPFVYYGRNLGPQNIPLGLVGNARHKVSCLIVPKDVYNPEGMWIWNMVIVPMPIKK